MIWGVRVEFLPDRVPQVTTLASKGRAEQP